MASKKRHRLRRPVVSRYRKKAAWPMAPLISMVTWVSQWRSRHGVFLFVLTFVVLMGLFYGVTSFTSFWREHFMPDYLDILARISGAVLSVLGQDTSVSGNSIFSPVFSVSIDLGCSALEPTALFVSAVLAFPVILRRKIAGLIAGILALAVLNLIRIVSLFLIGVYFPKIFHLVHIDIWQAMFVVMAIVLWVIWVLWTTKNQKPTENLSA